MRPTTTYYVFCSMLNFGMGATVTMYAPYLLSIGLSLGQVALVNAIFWVVLLSAELPTGMLADGRSRSSTLAAGAIFQAAGALAYVFAGGFWSAALAEALVGIGMAFLSGAQQAWIADALTHEGRSGELRRVYANEAILRGVTMLAGCLAGALVALADTRLIWVPMALACLAAALVAARSMNGRGEPVVRVTEAEALRKSIRLLRQSRDLAWVVLAMVVFGLVVTFNHFWSPYFEPRVGQFGLTGVWALIIFVYIPSGWLVRRMTLAVGQEWPMIAASLVLTGSGLVALGLMAGLALPIAAMIVHEFGRGLFQPLTDSFVQHRVESDHRATFGSLQSLVGRAGCALVPLCVWFAIDGQPNTPETIMGVWLVAGALLVAGAVGLWALRPRRARQAQ